MNDLHIAQLTKSYGPQAPVLQGLDLSVPGGSLAAVLGPSGCGKTTLLRIVAGFLHADAGTVTVGGRTLTGPGVRLPPERRRVGIVPQEGALFPHLSVARNVAFGLTGLDRAERRRRTEEMLDLVGLADYGDRMPHELSGGQQQRIALARALAPRPALVLLDEPFNALDSALRTGVRADVREALRATGATALLVTHDQQEALSTADLVAVVRQGRIAQCDTPQNLYRKPADAWVAGFVGDAVLLHATVGDSGTTATTPLGTVPLVAPPNGQHAGTVVLRPEQLRLTDPGAAGTVRGTVTDVCFYGHDTKVTVAVQGLDGTVDVRVAGPLEVGPGQETGIHVTGEATLHA
ncbi:ABC transporter ATP-binding protein [Streptomyces caniscabiei]|uniref:ABC-type quaternary amine transporter n=1 Tax=Streptomyces caniscabiei TaxID=2746961 RepID=A0A927QJV4_9ACTN|nr:ABC transporter ATP-binding protein [Streptomyces caniscabiei]MBD9724317.1 ABC transporter ATP-binding protein [Streptomyces caniscabiei]MDX3513308.1 ABC transporter ATP-binding protein [Streptomyces caniscabiei]MDX3718809.1 ABC transporter ATP-binding protein [Streptomyces caniscabiei]WEO21806.1 ABC transporter ATP-binding protein [Streptomyces caniscabiei]